MEVMAKAKLFVPPKLSSIDDLKSAYMKLKYSRS